ncbi:MAG: DNA-processing protein DprA [Patescibacteria group bacterium]
MKEKNTPFILALSAHEKIGGQTIKKILAVFSDLEKAWRLGETAISQSLGPKIAGLFLEARSRFSPAQEIERLQKLNIGYLTLYDKVYPPLLAEIPDAPAILYLRGDAAALKATGISIVGSRKYTHYGRRVVGELTRQCVGADLSIVSGLALGIDGEAHRVALKSAGTTVAVLGCGLDRVYPGSHLSLAREIIDSGGAVVSEFPPGTPAYPSNFPARNRIIAGLTLGTLVIEAGEESGSLITALAALEYNREVFAVPGPIDSPYSKGTNLLIQKGAKLVMSIEDILEELPVQLKEAQVKAREILPETAEESVILALLSSGEQAVDNLVLESKLNIIAINTALTMLEMKGMIENIGGGRYRKIS